MECVRRAQRKPDIGLTAALSPNYCVAITDDDEGDAQLRIMNYTLGEISNSTDDGMCLTCTYVVKP